MPLVRAMEIVAHEEPAPQQKIAQLGRLRICQIPVPHLDAVEPRPIVDFVAVVQIHRLFHRPRMNAGQTAHSLGKMAVRPRIIDGPVRSTVPPVRRIGRIRR